MRTHPVARWATAVVLVLGMLAPEQALYAQAKPKRTDIG
jgi:hypothetical protein